MKGLRVGQWGLPQCLSCQLKCKSVCYKCFIRLLLLNNLLNTQLVIEVNLLKRVAKQQITKLQTALPRNLEVVRSYVA